MTKPCIGIIVPCYNEEEVLPISSKELLNVLLGDIEKGNISSDSFICFVDDGSSDMTWNIISKLKSENDRFKGIKLTRNCGHQSALMAGLGHYTEQVDALVSIDADLQDDIHIIPKMISEYKEGRDIVYAVRSNRDKDTFFKRFTAESYYKTLSFLGVDLVYNHADYRLLSKKALQNLLRYKERNLFLRGVVPLLTSNSSVVTYVRNERELGESKYPLKKMIMFGWDGVTSFSVVPLNAVLFLGGLVCLVCVLMTLFYTYAWFIGRTLPGWASTVLPIYFIGGVQLLSVGIIGQYVGKIYKEVKSRPAFHKED